MTETQPGTTYAEAKRNIQPTTQGREASQRPKITPRKSNECNNPQ